MYASVEIITDIIMLAYEIAVSVLVIQANLSYIYIGNYLKIKKKNIYSKRKLNKDLLSLIFLEFNII